MGAENKEERYFLKKNIGRNFEERSTDISEALANWYALEQKLDSSIAGIELLVKYTQCFWRERYVINENKI